MGVARLWALMGAQPTMMSSPTVRLRPASSRSSPPPPRPAAAAALLLTGQGRACRSTVCSRASALAEEAMAQRDDRRVLLASSPVVARRRPRAIFFTSLPGGRGRRPRPKDMNIAIYSRLCLLQIVTVCAMMMAAAVADRVYLVLSAEARGLAARP